MKPSDFRPLSVAEVAERAAGASQNFDLAVREFIDTWGTMPRSSRIAAIAEEPIAVGRVEDAYLAALAEHLATRDRLDPPVWTEKPERFLREPVGVSPAVDLHQRRRPVAPAPSDGGRRGVDAMNAIDKLFRRRSGAVI